MIYPVAYLVLTSAITLLLIAVGLAGKAALAAELAVIQGAVLATFFAFSANTRNLILQGHGDLTPERLLAKRMAALPLVALAAYVLSVGTAGVSPVLAALIIARRSCEWLAEVRLCELEVAGERVAASRTLYFQAAVTIATAATLAFFPRAAYPALLVFAAAPVALYPPKPRLAAFRWNALRLTLRRASPYIGSTAIEGVSNYVLRLVVFLIAGREMSGLLFTAFVLGTFAGTMFGNVLGPTLALHRARSGSTAYRLSVVAAGMALAATGAVLAAASLASGLADWFGRPGYFWLALGLSLLGGAVLVAAHSIRLRLFDERRGDVLFGPDVLRNVAAIVAAPALYYVFAPYALAVLSLAMAMLTVFLYWGAERYALRASATTSLPVRIAVATGIVLPLFFLLAGRVYDAGALGGGLPARVIDLPLPISVIAMFAGIVLLARYREARLTFATVFFLFVGMVMTTAVAAQARADYELPKLLLLFQFLLPACALVLGEMFGSREQDLTVIATCFLAVLVVVVPIQLWNSIGRGALSPQVLGFAVYQHREYAPVVMLSAYVAALPTLWRRPTARGLLVALALPVGYYAALSASLTAVVLALLAAVALPAVERRDGSAWGCAALILVGLALDGSGLSRSVVLPVRDALPYWALYGSGIVESMGALLFGHAVVVERSVATSAHNYYLDLIYNFGLLGFAPLAWLVARTARRLWLARRTVLSQGPVLALAAAVALVLLLDSMFQVPLRQPYPGIFFFFLWGLLLARLRVLETAN